MNVVKGLSEVKKAEVLAFAEGIYSEGFEAGKASRKDITEDFARKVTMPKLNKQRAELIQQAREFVERFQAIRKGDEGRQDKTIGNSTARQHWYETEFIVKENKVTAVVYWLEHGVKRTKQSIHVGRAKCSPGDVFNEWIGKAIALARALEIEIPQEFIQAVQPNEVVVGMDVFYGGRNQLVDLHKKWLPVGVSKEFSLTALCCNIIVDTNAKYEVTP